VCSILQTIKGFSSVRNITSPGHAFNGEVESLTLVLWLGFLVTDLHVPGFIPGVTRFSEM
jgi:hypothetical protein